MKLDPNVIFEHCKDAYHTCGLKFQIPKNTPISKTYQWRLILSLTEKLESYGFDQPSAAIFIRCCAEYICENKLYKNGLSVMLKHSTLAACYNRLTRKQEEVKRQINDLISSRDFVASHIKSNKDILISKPSLSQPCNIVRWYSEGLISPLYLVLSSTGAAAVREIAESWPCERERLPKEGELYCLARRISDDPILREECKNVLGEDWREQCLLPQKIIHQLPAAVRRNGTTAHSALAASF